jgi:hypothetical protein
MSKYKNILRFIVFAVLPPVILLGILYIGFSPPIWPCWKPTHREIVRYTYSDIRAVKQIITVYELKSFTLPWTTNAVGMEQDAIELWNKLHTTDRIGKDFINEGLMFKDHVGTPYHVWFNTNTSAPMFIGSYSVTNRFEVWSDTRTITNRVAIWSDGRNKVNEYGGGDDINSWETLEENIARILPGE